MASIPLDLDETVDMREEAGRIVIEPVRKKAYDINALVRRITKKNLHEAADFGEAIGNEAW
jgi:antitoxin MazE